MFFPLRRLHFSRRGGGGVQASLLSPFPGRLACMCGVPGGPFVWGLLARVKCAWMCPEWKGPSVDPSVGGKKGSLTEMDMCERERETDVRGGGGSAVSVH